jgi:hypothetical protein
VGKGYPFDLFARYTKMWWLALGTAVIAGFKVLMLSEGCR